MRELVYKCDICGQECDPDMMLHTDDEKDVCEKCLAKLVKQHFKNLAYKETEDKAKVEGPIETKQYQRIDRGAAQALRNAGWPVSKIAKELKCSEQAVYNNTVKPEKKKPRPMEWVDDDINRMGNSDAGSLMEVMDDSNH